MKMVQTRVAEPGEPGQAIEVQGLIKAFGDRFALKGVDLQVERGACLVVLGANGAGKTTLIKVLATIYRPSSGSVRIEGLDTRHKSVQVRQQIGVLGHQTSLYDNLTAYENLRFYGRMYGVADLDGHIRNTIARVGLSAHLHQRAGTLSRGMQQRLAMARALLHSPPILLLDEPEAGLDQQGTALFREILAASRAQQKTVVLTTHNLEHGLAVADAVVVLTEGHISHQESGESLDAASLLSAYQKQPGDKN